MVGLAGLVVGARAANADVVALFADGHGGIASGGGAESAMAMPTEPGLGYRLGARLLIFEGYFDHTGFGGGAGVSRGIVGLRGGFGFGRDFRLVLRAGAGAIEEQGGALTGRVPGTPERRGAVGRIGAALEGKVAPLLFVGLGIDAEEYALPSATGPFGTTASTYGSDIFANFHLMFELGV